MSNIDSCCLKYKEMITVALLPVHITFPLAYSLYNWKDLRNDSTALFWTFLDITYCIYF